jgi:hypothetical protein
MGLGLPMKYAATPVALSMSAATRQKAFDDAADLDSQAFLGKGRNAFQIENAQQFLMDLRLQLEVAIRGAAVRGCMGSRCRVRNYSGCNPVRKNIVT